MRDRTLITTGAIGAVLAAICCMTPLLVVVFGAVGSLLGSPRPIMC
jgi:mercuric ion transport protein